jgi:glycosyltransferase involved in cell wall biosynthesis
MELLAELAENPFYLSLYQMAHEEPLKHVIEIGSSTGTGSTRILVEALKSRSDVALYCLEAQPEKYAELQARYAGLPWVHCLPYFAKDPIQFPSREQIWEFYRHADTVLRRYSFDEVFSWLESELKLYAQRPHQVSGVAWLRQQYGIEHFDLAVLDGSEFTGDQDLDLVYGARVLILDDVTSYKNHANYRRLMQDPAYVLIQENLKWQHGTAVFKQKQFQKPGLSVIVHTRNAAQQLPACLESVAWADEVLVIDMASTDQTVQIAEAQGARILHHVPVDCVDEARNWGLSQVAYDWTLVVDADERIPPGLAGRIQELLAARPIIAGYWLPRRNFFFGQPVADLFPDYQLRLFRSQHAFWRGLVHELPGLKGKSAQFPAEADYAIQHHSYQNVADFCQRQLRYAETLWRQLGRYPVQSVPQLAHELRDRYEQKQLQQLHYLQDHAVDNHEWLVRQLYLFTELAVSGTLLERSGQLEGANPGQHVKLSGYSYLKNAERFDYPFIESLLSVMDICDEVVVSYATDSEDQTAERLKRLALIFPKLRVFATDVWKQNRTGGETIALAATEAMQACRGDWLWHVQADEVYSQRDARQVRKLVEMYHAQPVHAFRFHVVHFYGDYDTAIDVSAAEIGWYQHTIRLARAGQGQHFGDAWTLSLSGEGAIIQTDVRIYHYGHVREIEAMRHKASYMERLYHELPESFEICKPGEFSYDRVPEAYLRHFEHSHPEAMLSRIAQWRLNQGLKDQSRKPRLLVLSRFHQVKKGYGITFNELYQTGFLQQHFEIHHLAWHYEQAPAMFDGVMVYPCIEEHKVQALRDALYRIEPDVILLHADAHFYRDYLSELLAWRGPIVGWFTIDYERRHNPAGLLALYQRCNRILCMADASIKQTRQDYAGPIAKVPLGVNAEIFKPVTPARKRELRHELGLPSQAYLFVMVANNFWRKGLEYAILALSRFVERYPDLAATTVLYLHTESTDQLLELIRDYGVTEQVRISHGFDPFKQPLSETRLAELYQTADAFLLPSLGEGFGMPVLEAQACGLPLIISDNSVLREVGGDAALYIRCPGYVGGQNAGSHVWLRAPDPDHTAELMFQLRTQAGLQARLSAASQRQARDSSWKRSALLLAAELATAKSAGTLEYLPPEPSLRAV